MDNTDNKSSKSESKPAVSDSENKENNRENVSLIANDINNQLSGIIGNAELLKQDNLDPYEKSKLICNIVACAKQTTYLTEKIIDLESSVQEPAQEKTKDPNFYSSEFNTVLVIDDEEVIRKVARSILQRAGYKVILAANGKEGLDKYQENAKDILCVLLDLTMPFMPGNLVYAKLKAVDPAVKVFLMSGLSLQHVMQQFETEEVAGFIKKPFLMEELLDKIDSAKQIEVH